MHAPLLLAGVIRSPGFPLIFHSYPRTSGGSVPLISDPGWELWLSFWPPLIPPCTLVFGLHHYRSQEVFADTRVVVVRDWLLPTVGGKSWLWYHASWKAELCLLLPGQIRTPGFLFSLFVYYPVGVLECLVRACRRWKSRLLIQLCWCWWGWDHRFSCVVWLE